MKKVPCGFIRVGVITALGLILVPTSARALTTIVELVGTGDQFNASGTISYVYSSTDPSRSHSSFKSLNFFFGSEPEVGWDYSYGYEVKAPHIDGYNLVGGYTDWLLLDSEEVWGMMENLQTFIPIFDHMASMMTYTYEGITAVTADWFLESDFIYVSDGTNILGTGTWSYRTIWRDGITPQQNVPDSGATAALFGFALLGLCSLRIPRRR